jgi:predicted nucleic acid-binding protein
MKTTYLLDTNVFLRLILKDNLEQYKQIIGLLEQSEFSKINLVCPLISLFEITFVLSGKTYQRPKNEIATILKTLLKLRIIKFESEEIFALALDIFLENSISIVDSFLLSSSQIQKYEFYSFDQKALKISKTLKNQ